MCRGESRGIRNAAPKGIATPRVVWPEPWRSVGQNRRPTVSADQPKPARTAISKRVCRGVADRGGEAGVTAPGPPVDLAADPSERPALKPRPRSTDRGGSKAARRAGKRGGFPVIRSAVSGYARPHSGRSFRPLWQSPGQGARRCTCWRPRYRLPDILPRSRHVADRTEGSKGRSRLDRDYRRGLAVGLGSLVDS
jgi:hypothetical protein